jgi:hypothetical protein
MAPQHVAPKPPQTQPGNDIRKTLKIKGPAVPLASTIAYLFARLALSLIPVKMTGIMKVQIAKDQSRKLANGKLGHRP